MSGLAGDILARPLRLARPFLRNQRQLYPATDLLAARPARTSKLRQRHQSCGGCRAHAGGSGPGHSHDKHSHSHSHEHRHGHSHEHSHGHPHSHSHSHGHVDEHHHHSESEAVLGHSHEPTVDHSNPVHRLLKWLYDSTRLTPLAAWLESSVPSSIAKVALFLVAAATAWLTGQASTQAALLLQRVSAAATAGVYFFAGLPAAVSLSYDLTAARIDTHVLMNLAVVGTLATGYALEGALLLVLFQSSHVVEHMLTHKAQGDLQALFDAMPSSATLVSLNADGSPDMASASKVLAGDVSVGEHMLVKPGEQVPLDGEIVHGRALVSAEHITGEALPVLKRPGDDLAAGSLNRDGLLVVRASRLAAESTPARIARMTMEAQAARPRLRSWLDDFGDAYSKAVVAASLLLLAALLASGVPLLGTAAQRGALYRTMGLLTTASPCALVMVPLAYVSAIAAVASRGILLRGGRVLDALAACSTVAFDKTGTLTTGSLYCTGFRQLQPSAEAAGSQTGDSYTSSSSSSSEEAGSSAGGSDGGSGSDDSGAADGARRAAVEAAVALSLRSSHPVSDAVVLLGEQLGVGAASVGVSDFLLVAGGGVQAELTLPSLPSSNGGSGSTNGSAEEQQQRWRAAFGSVEYVSARLEAAEVAALEQLSANQAATGVLSVLVMEPAASTSGSSSSSSSSSRSVWVATFEDSVRQQSSAAVHALQTGAWTGRASEAAAVEVVMLTGDNEANASRVAEKLGIASVLAGLTPEQKLEQVQLRRRSCSSGSGGTAKGAHSGGRQGVVMVGDGINDAPALAAADVGVAVASSTSTAASLAADAIVMGSSGIAAVPFLLAVARSTQAVIKQNLVLAFGSILALALPTVLGFLPLWVAVMLHEGSTLLVALNSLRLLRLAGPHGGVSPRAHGSSHSAGSRHARQHRHKHPLEEEADGSLLDQPTLAAAMTSA